jgi:hypothetical protein
MNSLCGAPPAGCEVLVMLELLTRFVVLMDAENMRRDHVRHPGLAQVTLRPIICERGLHTNTIKAGPRTWKASHPASRSSVC